MGFIADKLGKYKAVLLLSLVLVIGSSVGILFVPRSPQALVHERQATNYSDVANSTGGDYEVNDHNGNVLMSKFDSRHQVTFWSYFLLRIVFSTFSNICFSLVEATR